MRSRNHSCSIHPGGPGLFGISFANPAVLHGLWAATLPTLIHLLNRRRTVTVSFSNVALLQTLQQDRMRRVRIKQWVLLAVRTLLIALLVMAFARPTIRDASFGRGHGETAAVVLVDRSLSMRQTTEGRSLMDHAKDLATSALEQLDGRDEVVLVAFDTQIDGFVASPVDRLRLSVPGLEATYLSTDPVPALDGARRWLRESEALNRELYVVSDFARSGWKEVEAYDGFDGSTVFLLKVPDAGTTNVAVCSIRPSGALLSVGEPTLLVAEVENLGAERVTSLPVQVFVEDQRIGQRFIQLDPGERRRVTFRYTPDRGGARAIRVEIPDDDFAEDNVRSTVIHIPVAIRVVVVGDDRDRYYVEEGLASGSGVVVNSIQASELGGLNEAEVDVLVLCSLRTLGRGTLNAIRRVVSRGAGLLLLMGDGLDVRLYNERVLPALCPAQVTGVEGSRGRTRFTSLDADHDGHPVLDDLLGADLTGPRFYLNYAVSAMSPSRVVAVYKNGMPALLEHRLERGRALLLTSHTDLEWSDQAVTGFFAPFVHRAVRYLATGGYGRDDVTVGQRVTRPVQVGRDRDAVVQSPIGPSETVWAQQLGDRLHWVIEQAHTPGIWQIYSGERVSDRFAAQIDPRESDSDPMDDEILKGLFPGSDVVFAEADADLSAVVAGYRHGAELWRYVLAAALIFLAIELALMSGETRERDPGSARNAS
ncbi:TPA: hypothetical protein DCE37_19830 [Candidatus Latescibacteria bacterium]|nr:hypothetical protein [Candidatus Latescibacterota bacterium]